VLHADGTATIYTFMGITNPANANTITAASFRITIPGDSVWAPIADAPLWEGRARIAASAITVNNNVYLLGGYTVSDDGTETTDPRLLHYEPDTDSWTELSRPLIQVDDTVALVYADRYIILCSGWHGPILDNTLAVQLYDTHTDTWTRLNDMPGPATGLFGHAGGISGDNILIAGGATTNDGYKISAQVLMGTITTNANNKPERIDWATAQPHPGDPAYRAAYASVDAGNGKLFIVGGTNNPYNITGIGYDKISSQPNAQTLMYTASTSQWSRIKSNNDYTPTMDHRALVSIGNDGSQWVIVGGMTAPNTSSSLVQLLTLHFADEAIEQR